MLTVPLVSNKTMPEQASLAVMPGSLNATPSSFVIGSKPLRTSIGGISSRTTIALVEKDLLPDASATMMTTELVPGGNGELFVRFCVMVSAPDKSEARMKFVPVTSGITAMQLEFAASTR